jgi:hypothetical protein
LANSKRRYHFPGENSVCRTTDDALRFIFNNNIQIQHTIDALGKTVLPDLLIRILILFLQGTAHLNLLAGSVELPTNKSQRKVVAF